MATVRFNHEAEFLAELRLEAAAGRVDRKILRLTSRWRQGDPYPIRSLSVVASFSTGPGQVTVLERRVGSHFPDTNEARKDVEECDKVLAELNRAGAELGLELRHGSLEA